MTLSRRTATMTFASAVVWLWLFPLAVPASASCAMPARESAYRFTGTVIATDDSGGTATVHTDDGLEVTVVGREGGQGVISSVDRTYERGRRYEFHPLNAQSPYRDNACTATKEIGAAPAEQQAVGGDGADTSVGPTPSPIRWLGLGALLIPLLLGAVLASRWALRAKAARD